MESIDADTPYNDYVLNGIHSVEEVPDENEDDNNFKSDGPAKDTSAPTKGAAKGDTEQLAELSEPTLGKYVLKAVTAHSMAHVASQNTTGAEKEHWDKQVKKRKEGISAAIHKLDKMNEEEDLQELSKPVLASYIKKASRDALEQGRKAKTYLDMAGSLARNGDEDGRDDAAEKVVKHTTKRANRLDGISKAADKLAESYTAGEFKLHDGSTVTVSENDAECLNRMVKGTSNKASLEKTLKKNLKEFNAILQFAKTIKEEDLQELSKKTLGSYLEKSTKDYADRSAKYGDGKKQDNRVKGGKQASERLKDKGET